MTPSLQAVAAEVARSLATADMVDGSAFISTPLMYPGGASVVVRLDDHGGRFRVSDVGVGRREADLMDGDRFYRRIGRDVAARFGLSFDDETFFVPEADRSDLVDLVALVANASRSAVEATAWRVAERAVRDGREILRVKLRDAFDPAQVRLDFDIRGASNDAWSFDAALDTPRGLTLFQMVTPADPSVYSAVSRFVDVAERADPPRLVAVLVDPDRTSHLRLVERSARTIPLAADLAVWRRTAA